VFNNPFLKRGLGARSGTGGLSKIVVTVTDARRREKLAVAIVKTRRGVEACLGKEGRYNLVNPH